MITNGPLGAESWDFSVSGSVQRTSYSTTQNDQLKAWTVSGAYTLTSATRDSDGVITTATVSWPDGSGGTFTTVTKNLTFFTVDSYTATHSVSRKIATQPPVTRDASGNVTAQPAITIS